MAKHADEVPSGWFADGRNPWVDIFTPEVILNLGKVIGLHDHVKLDRLAVDICRVAERYVTSLDEAAIELTNKERIDWFKDNILSPSEKLMISLDISNSRYSRTFPPPHESEWPDQPRTHEFIGKKWETKEGTNKIEISEETPHTVPLGSSRENLVNLMIELRLWVAEVIEQLENKPSGDFKPINDLKYALVQELTYLYAKYTSDQKLLTKDYCAIAPTPYVGFVRTVAGCILGSNEKLTDQIKMAKKSIINIENFDPSIGLRFC